MWSFIREALGPDWEAPDLAEFLQARANQTNIRRRLFWLVFAAMSWTLWTIRNKMVIGHVLLRRASDMLFKFLAFLQQWRPLSRRKDRDFIARMTEALTSTARRLASSSLAS